MTHKERIVGLLVIVGLLTLALPVLLEKDLPFDPQQHIVAIPKAPKFKPVEVKSHSTQALKKAKKTVEQRRQKFFAQNAAKQPKTNTKQKKTLHKGAWLVQVSSFKDKNNAKTLTQKLQTHKFKAFIKNFTKDKETFYRVYIGPENEWNNIEAIKQELKQKLSLNGIIIKYDPIIL